MSLFNADQIRHMEYLNSLPLEDKCWCGWFKLGECATCPPDRTAADKLAVSCPGCGGSPGPGGIRLIIHRAWCTI